MDLTRFTAGGRTNVHLRLQIAAFVACRFNPDLTAKYDQLRTAGKAQKVAIKGMLRKLIVLANTLLRKKEMGPEMA